MIRIMLAVVMIILSSCSVFDKLNDYSASSMESHNGTKPYNFPLELYCSDGIMGDGSSWEGITIGSSSLGDLAGTLFLQSDEYEVVSEGNEVRFSIFDWNTVSDTDIPTTVKACVLDDIVMALSIGHNLADFPNLDEYIAQYGKPDAVTWSELETSRVVLWFEEGIAANVGVTDEGFGTITLSVYMPYQPATGFETRWPYNRTRNIPPLSGDEVYTPPLPTQQNPFDFESIIATMTAEPSRTATPMPVLVPG